MARKTFPWLTLLTLATLAVLVAVFAYGSGSGEAPSEPFDRQRIAAEGLGRAIFAGGCFWCMEPPFDHLDGVEATISGYIGGSKEDPTYKEVSAGTTGHTEAVEVIFDPKKVSYQELLDVFWHNIDPTMENRQFCDWGSQYRTGIFFLDAAQQEQAAASKQALIDSERFPKVVTEITQAEVFYPAEEYHQDFYLKNPAHYKRYRSGCGRDQRLQELWGS